MRKKRESRCELTDEKQEALLIEVLKCAMTDFHEELKEISK
jgi:hypothetical protein